MDTRGSTDVRCGDPLDAMVMLEEPTFPGCQLDLLVGFFADHAVGHR